MSFPPFYNNTLKETSNVPPSQPSYHPRYHPYYPSERQPQSTLSQINDGLPSYSEFMLSEASVPSPVSQEEKPDENAVRIVMEQPTPTVHTVRVRSADFHRCYVIVCLVILVIGVLTGNVITLYCTIPALIFAVLAKSSNNNELDLQSFKCSLMLNIAAIAWWTVCVLVISISMSMSSPQMSNRHCNNHRNSGYTYVCN